MTKKRYPSSTDVARLAGVSQATVSRSLADDGRVLAATRQKVIEAARVLGYSPSFIPRILLDHRSHLVAIVMSGSDNPFYLQVVDAFTVALQAADYQVLLVHVESEHALDGVLPKLASYRVDAIVSALPVLSRATAARLARLRIPAVSFNTPLHNRFVASVAADNRGGGAAIAELLVRRGARRFGFIAGCADSHASRERQAGFSERLQALGHALASVADGGFSYDGGLKVTLRLAAAGELPRGLFCANDLMALGAIDALRHELHMRVPEDVMVAGFDDVPQAAWLAYGLTSVVQDGPAMVQEAMAILGAMMGEGGPRRGSLRVVPVQLVERASTAPRSPPGSPRPPPCSPPARRHCATSR